MLTKDTSGFDEELLLLELRNNSSLAFDALYHKYWDLVYVNAHKRLRDQDQAKDITQEIFLKLWSNRHSSKIRNLPAYLHTAVKNAVFNHFEKEKKYTPVSTLLLETEAAREQADAHLLGKELYKTYECLLKTLSNAQQAIFKMRFHQDESTSEIAQKLGISRKTVQNQLGKSLLVLRDALFLLMTLLIRLF
ncbi:putative RNA polymerase sigma factor [Pedobacter sp. BAL39]|uniref:sigma-70 family RNA polymerase sigma factor n=1 Tax=Pedobacter sp. BAL39 TaxID=391596 RepID=UPI0001559B37|nr:sigma-70 family RNA polymerase sigma factor [Pedobacter sp. BAL39]EDM35486.1 putative RNA polymerase sigma factor [Pedobacter sp. BAL39]